MLRRWLIRVLVLSGVASLVLGIVSIWRPFAGAIPVTDRVWCQAVAVGGNSRILLVLDKRESAKRDGTGFDDAKLFWERHLFVALPFRWRFDIYDDPTDFRYGIYEIRLDLSLYVLSVTMFALAWFIGPGARLLAHLPGVWREIRCPSDGGFLWPATRAIHRSIIAMLLFVASIAFGFIVARSARPWSWANPLASRKIESVGVADGMLRVVLQAPQAQTANFRSFERRWPGIRIRSGYSASYLQQLFNNPVSVSLFPDRRQRPTTSGMTMFPPGARNYQLEIDLCVPWLLSLIYPCIALLRGPIRRRHRCLRGRCVGCGYSLTGLIEPRCPECGAGFNPDLLDLSEWKLFTIRQDNVRTVTANPAPPV